MLWEDILNQLKTVLFGNQCYARQCCTRPRCIKQHEKFSLRESEISTTQCVFEAINASKKPQAIILGKIAGSYKRVQKVFLATNKMFLPKKFILSKHVEGQDT